MSVAIASDTRLETVTRMVQVEGFRPIMFDRYAGDNNTRLAWNEKMYLRPGTNQLGLPIDNVFSFYTAINTSSAPKRLRDSRKYKDICSAIQSFVLFEGEDGGEYIDFKRDGKVIEVGSFDEHHDELSGLTFHHSVARLPNGIPNPKERPLLPLPWTLRFRMTIIPNALIKEAEIKNLTVEGGIVIGFGTYRGRYGKFQVTEWSPSDN